MLVNKIGNFGQPRKKSGFTLLEIVIVLGVLGIVSFIIFSSTGGSQETTRYKGAVQIISTVEEKLKQMKSLYGCWPTSIQGMQDKDTFVDTAGAGNSCVVTTDTDLANTWAGSLIKASDLNEDNKYKLPALNGNIDVHFESNVMYLVIEGRLQNAATELARICASSTTGTAATTDGPPRTVVFTAPTGGGTADCWTEDGTAAGDRDKFYITVEDPV